MHNRLIIIGSGGHGKVVLDIALKNGYDDIVFIDDNAKGKCMGFPIIGTTAKLQELNDGKTDFVIAVGNNKVRANLSQKFDLNYVTLVHPSAHIGLGVEIKEGTVIMAGAIINADSTVGKHCIINSNSVVEHENVIGDYAHISPGVALGGMVSVGKNTHIGIGTIVKNNISICGDCVIGAGAVVVRNITQDGVYIGVPAFRVEENT